MLIYFCKKKIFCINLFCEGVNGDLGQNEFRLFRFLPVYFHSSLTKSVMTETIV